MRRTKDIKRILRGQPYYDENKKLTYFMFSGFYDFIKNQEWKKTENETHMMLKEIVGISRQKMHIEGNTKKWVYIIDQAQFNVEEEVEQNDVNFPTPEY